MAEKGPSRRASSSFSRASLPSSPRRSGDGSAVASTNRVLDQRPPGVVILKPDLTVSSQTAGAGAWLEALPAAQLFALWGMLPAVVYPVATRARTGGTMTGAQALERDIDGRWVMIEAASLEGDGRGKIAITLRGAAPTETFDLLCRAYALTPRERDVVAAVVAGLDTNALSERLSISRHTVQDHLKSVFQKIGIRSRRELLATFTTASHKADV